MLNLHKYYNQYRYRHRGDLSDKCRICALCHKYHLDDKETDENVKRAAELDHEAGLVVYPSRKMPVSMNPDTDENVAYFCVLGHKKYWRKKHKKCPDWQLSIPSSDLRLGDHLGVHYSRVNARVANRLTILTIVVAVVGIVVSVASQGGA